MLGCIIWELFDIIMYFCLFFGGMGDRGYSEETTDDVDENEKIKETIYLRTLMMLVWV